MNQIKDFLHSKILKNWEAKKDDLALIIFVNFAPNWTAPLCPVPILVNIVLSVGMIITND